MSEEKQEINVIKKDKKCKKLNKIVLPSILCVILIALIILSIVNKIKTNKNIELIRNASIGDIVTFGKYEQDNNFFNGKEDIEWIILKKKDGKALLLSKYALDGKKYNNSDERTNWEECSLRKWLNSHFYLNAFCFSEMAKIEDTIVSADKNPDWPDVIQGNEVEDKLFLLSYNEADEYWDILDNTDCESTKYARKTKKLASSTANNYKCDWWLRTMSWNGSEACKVTPISIIWDSIDLRSGVRPSLWVQFDGN